MKGRMCVVICILLFLVGLSGCGSLMGGENDTTDKPKQIESYGQSVNMRNGGLVAGNEQGIYYVWDGVLYEQKEGATAQAVDTNGARFLCLTEDTLYYVSEDEAGNTGIYRVKQGENERSLVFETACRYLYEREGYLYFIDYPKQKNICRVNLDGTEFTTLVEGAFDGLIVCADCLYYRDLQTKQYMKQSFADEGLTEPKVWISYTTGRMPQLDGQWIYYSIGDFLYHYRVSTEDATQMGRVARASNQVLFWQNKKYEDQTLLDMESGEQSLFQDNPYIKFYGVAGDLILYEVEHYTEEALLQTVPQSEAVSLYAYSMTEKTNRLLEERQLEVNPEEIYQDYDRLLRGDLSLLGNEQEWFADLYDSQEAWKHWERDMDGDGAEERFLTTGEKTILLHHGGNEIQYYLMDDATKEGRYELLSDGSILYYENYQGVGYANEAYTVYRYQPGGDRTQENSLQHLTTNLEEISLDQETDTQVKSDLYYVQDGFTGQAEWEKALQEVLEKRIIAE